MTQEECKAISDKMDSMMKEFKDDPKKALEFLVKAGICNEDGTLVDFYNPEK